MSVPLSNAYLEQRLSGGAANADPDASLGGEMSTELVQSQSSTALSNVTGVTVLYAGGNPTGVGALAFTISNTSLTWTPNGLEAGDAVDVGEDGRYAIFGEQGVLLVEVDASSLPAGDEEDSVTIANIANEVWDNVAKGESFAGDTEYRCTYVANAYPAAGIASITRSGSTATVTTDDPHGLITGDEVTIVGCVQPEYNGTFEVTVGSDPDAFEYTVAGSPATPATGTPKWGQKFLATLLYIATQPDPGVLAVGADPAGVGDGVTRSVSSITRSGSVATVTTDDPHGYETGQSVTIVGADQAAYNGVQTITVTAADVFTYAVSGSPATPATGTITAARGVATTVADENTAPAGVTFSEPSEVGDALDLGELRPGEAVAFWERRAIPLRNTTTNLETLAKLAFAPYI